MIVGRPRSSQAHEAILDAAIEEFAAHGRSGMTIEQVAARSGVARSTVYRRWKNIDELCLEALQHLQEPVPPPPGRSVREDLTFLLCNLRHLLTETRVGRLIPELAAEAARRPDLSRTYWAQYLARDRSPFADVLRRGIAEGLLRSDLDLELAVDLLTGPVFKRALWQLDTPDADLEAIIDSVLAGLAAPAATSARSPSARKNSARQHSRP